MKEDDLRDAARRMILYFEPGVLAAYQQDAHHYEVRTDNFDGSVAIRDDFFESLSEDDRREKVLHVDFGFRAKSDGSLAVAVWAPDICDRAGDEHQRKWAGFQIEPDSFPQEFDGRFSLWTQRILGGSWDVEDGPLSRLRLVVSEVNALTEEALGQPLFKAETSSRLVFPSAENDAAYRDAHSAVYGFVIDGLDKATIAALAEKLGQAGRFGSDRTLAALKKVVRSEAVDALLFPALERVSETRRAADHGVQATPTQFAAFDQFSADIERVVAGTVALRDFLSTELRLDPARCIRRRQARRMLPQFDGERRSEAHYSIVGIASVIGKTIARVEYGFMQPRRGVHDSELIHLHFTDGSAMSICTGSNAGNLSERHEGLRAEDYHSSFDLHFVPPARAPVDPDPAGDM